MATIEARQAKDGKNHFKVTVRLKGYPVQRATFHRITDAKKWVQQTESAIREGRHLVTTESKRHTLGEAIDRYIREVLPQKPRSVKQQTPQLEWWKERLGDYTLAKVTPPVLVEQRAILAKEKSGATANRYMAVLSHLFTVAMKEWGWIDNTPIRKISRLKESRGVVRFLSDEEREALLKACRENPNPHLYDVVIVALSTGCRKNEIMTLRWPDVDLDRGQITLLDTKNKTPRAVPLVGYALARMKERAKTRRMDTDLVFPCATKPVPADIDRDFALARAAAKIENFRFHDLRHSAASYLAMNGATLPEIAAVLGHKTLQMVQRYAHLSDAHTAGVVQRMNDRIFSEPSTQATTGEAR